MRMYAWYIEPEDPNTNLALSMVLPEENYYEGLPDKDGCPRNVWACDYRVVKAVKAGRTQRGVRFKVFVREGNGRMRPANFLLFKKKAPASTKTNPARSRQAVS